MILRNCLVLGTALVLGSSEATVSPLAKGLLPKRLSELVTKRPPWVDIEPMGEQMYPFSVGADTWDFIYKAKREPIPRLFAGMKELAEKQADALLAELGITVAEFEVWPVYTEEGDATWAFARWRKTDKEPWSWLTSELVKPGGQPPVLMPVKLRTWVAVENKRLFEDFAQSESLYSKPAFASGVWHTEDGKSVISGWPSAKEIDSFAKRTKAGERFLVNVIPSPARQEEKPLTFVFRRLAGKSEWEPEVRWDRTEHSVPPGKVGKIPPLSFLPTFATAFRKDVEVFSTSHGASFRGKHYIFERKNSMQSDHQLESLADYLQARYEALGLEVRRQRFTFNGTTHSNLIAVIPGSLPKGKNQPVLLADHYDTAFCEDVFDKTGQKVSSSGANDNAAASATLLRAAETLAGKKPKHDIWLTHLTGEEYPAESLGMRRMLEQFIRTKTPVRAMVLLDLIGYRRGGEKVFHLNPGNSAQSLVLAKIAMAISEKAAPAWEASIRTRYDLKSYLYNTDGIFADFVGFPVLYFNENLHRDNMDDNPHYHQSTDVPSNLDWDFAEAIAKTAIWTAYTYAN